MMMMTIYCTVLLINFMVNEDFRKQGRWFFGIEETKLLTARRRLHEVSETILWFMADASQLRVCCNA